MQAYQACQQWLDSPVGAHKYLANRLGSAFLAGAIWAQQDMTGPQPLDKDLQAALDCDGAIRLVDGLWSQGFVGMMPLTAAILKGQLRTEIRNGMAFAVAGKGTDVR